MMKNVLSSMRGQARTVVRQLCTSNGSAPVTGVARGFLLQPTKLFQVQPSAVLVRPAVRFSHDQRPKGDEELIGFLEEEIATEKKMQRATSIPTTFEGFSVKLGKSDINLSRPFGNEQIVISAQLNHSVDSDYEDPNAKQSGKEPAADEMRSRPHFDVEIRRGNEILCFSCSYLQNPAAAAESQEDFNDVFSIDEVSLHDGDIADNDYVVAGDILDGYLYDLFMNMLEERGVTNEFADKFSDLCTDYEHSLYVDLLVKLQKFLKN